jgi:membrane-bound serine protease (ClpP class)
MSPMELVIALLVVGALLVLAETILPGMVAGILGGLCLLAGVLVAFVELGPRAGSYVLLVVLGALAMGTFLWLKYFPETRLARKFISESSVGNLDVEQPLLLHQTGTALSHLRPSGMALVNGRRVDVVTEGSMIDKGTPIRVVAIEGMRVIVRAVPQTELSTQPKPTT